ncbi:MAG TPA: hypothetical protein VHL79_04665 [Ramlibacter sp.]|jgi:hypothetical protein|nr:hypothetical protein [Ramlibacter sp.]
MAHVITPRIVSATAASVLLAGCGWINAPGWGPSPTTEVRQAVVVPAAAAVVSREEACAEFAWRMSFQFPQDRSLVYNQEYTRCMQPVAAAGASPAVAPAVVAPGSAGGAVVRPGALPNTPPARSGITRPYRN